MKKYAGKYWDGKYEVTMRGGCGGEVQIKTPFDISLSPEEAAEIVREFWTEIIVPVQKGFMETSELYLPKRDNV